MVVLLNWVSSGTSDFAVPLEKKNFCSSSVPEAANVCGFKIWNLHYFVSLVTSYLSK